MKKIKVKNIKTTDEAKKYLENIELENHDIDKIDVIVGHFLAPIATALGITICMVAGNRMDRKNKGEQVSNGFISFMEDIISIVMKFFKLLIDAFNIIKDYYSDNLVIQT